MTSLDFSPSALRVRSVAVLLGVYAMAATFGGACSNDEAKQAALEAAKKRVLRGADRYPNEGLIITKADLNRDGLHDMYSVYQEETEGEGSQAKTTRTLMRKEIDVNYDGQIDVWRHYNKGGLVTQEDSDYNFDGRVDAVSYFDKGVRVRTESDTDGDDTPDVFKFYKGDILLRIERDTDSNGNIDYWEFYERGALDRIGRDTTGDGNIDAWDSRR